jgi:23S rRNA pseudouridine1911/1915/1917 synthase
LALSKGLRAGIALVRCELATGRMHQVRVHLASIGCPIAGDRVYGNLHARPLEDPRLAAAIRAVPRHALHAWRLTIPEREPGARRQFVAPLPADMTQLLEAAGIAVEAALARA